MVAELISVGTELLLGNTVNTNSNYLARKCAEFGISNFYQITVGDNEERLSHAIKVALERSDIVILTGGLGPTKDDLTKEITAKVLKKELIEDSEVKDSINNYFRNLNRKVITENNWKQSMIIEGATVVENHNGTAPGLVITSDEGKIVILLPGPPRELIPMFDETIGPYLKSLLPGILYSKMIKVCGIGESLAETMISDLIDQQTNPTIAPYAKTGEVHFRITANVTNKKDGEELIKPVLSELKRRFGNSIYTTDETENLEDVIVKLLSKNQLKLTTAESCTGGLVSGRIVNVSGASNVFGEGFITYSNNAKEKYLGVKKETLQQYGAVSKETAKEMALGAASVSESEVSLAVTGLAGPDGGSEQKPIGLVYIACCINDKVKVEEFHFGGNRQKIRETTATYALNLLRISLLNEFEN